MLQSNNEEREEAQKPILDAEALDYYWDNAYDFVYEQIIVPARQKTKKNYDISWQQKDLLDSVSIDNRISIESGHGTGKSTCFSWVGIWFITTRFNTKGFPVKVPVFAPTYHQLYDIIWPEFKRWLGLSRIGQLYTYNKNEVYRNGKPEYKDLCWIRARSPDNQDAVQGMHAEHLLVIADEAFGIIDEGVWETIEGYMTQVDNKMLIGGQHRIITGYVHDTFHKDKDSWRNLRFDSEASPLADKAFIERIARKYGRDSDVFKIRVLGTEPSGNPASFISYVQADAARLRWKLKTEFEPNELIFMGLDPARFGDDLSVLTTIIGDYPLPQDQKGTTDTDDLENMVLNRLRTIRKDYKIKSRCVIRIDNSGGYGAGVIDKLSKNTIDNIEVVPVNFGGEGDEEYANAVSLMWGEMREWVKTKAIPDDDDLIAEMSARRKMPEVDRRGRLQIEPKDRFKKEYGHSPDKTDSFALAVARNGQIKRVLPQYISTSGDHRRNVTINWEALEPVKWHAFISLYFLQDTGIYGGFYFWWREKRRLLIYDELFCQTPTVDHVLAEMMQRAQIALKKKDDGFFVTRIYGNEPFFEKGGINLSMQFARYGITISRNPTFDENSACTLANTMFSKNQIVLHYERTPITDHDLRMWRIEGGKPVPGFPMARALLGVASELKSAGELDEKDVYQKGYSNERNQIREMIKAGRQLAEKNEWDYLAK